MSEVSSSSKKLLAAAALGSVVIVLCLALGWSWLDSAVAQVQYEAHVESVAPSRECLRGGVAGLVGGLLTGDRAQKCTVQIATSVTVNNPAPLGVQFRVIQVTARVAGRALPKGAVIVPDTAVTVSPGGSGRQFVRFNADVGDVLAAATSVLMHSEVLVEIDAEVEVTALGGLIGSRRSVHIEKELTVSDITAGIRGNAATK